jgi:hypothetical protein
MISKAFKTNATDCYWISYPEAEIKAITSIHYSPRDDINHLHE